MANNLPYMMSTGTLPKILNKICEASTPENFNHDFLGTKLGFPGGNQKAFIPWAKKCGLINEDGVPTNLYKDFRNPQFRGSAMAQALRKGYSELYLRNENAHDLSKPDFTKLVTDTTGLSHDNSVVKGIVNTFFNAKEFADFITKKTKPKEESITKPIEMGTPIIKSNDENPVSGLNKRKINLGIGYTINLVLPKTDDPAIYNAIFKSLKDNLLDE